MNSHTNSILFYLDRFTYIQTFENKDAESTTLLIRAIWYHSEKAEPFKTIGDLLELF